MEQNNATATDAGVAATTLVIPSLDELAARHGTKALRACIARPELGVVAFGALTAYKRVPAFQRLVRGLFGAIVGGAR